MRRRRNNPDVYVHQLNEMLGLPMGTRWTYYYRNPPDAAIYATKHPEDLISVYMDFREPSESDAELVDSLASGQWSNDPPVYYSFRDDNNYLAQYLPLDSLGEPHNATVYLPAHSSFDPRSLLSEEDILFDVLGRPTESGNPSEHPAMYNQNSEEHPFYIPSFKRRMRHVLMRQAFNKLLFLEFQAKKQQFNRLTRVLSRDLHQVDDAVSAQQRQMMDELFSREYNPKRKKRRGGKK